MAKMPELHSFPDSVVHSELLQNKVQKLSPMLCLSDVENLHNYKGEKELYRKFIVLSRPMVVM